MLNIKQFFISRLLVVFITLFFTYSVISYFLLESLDAANFMSVWISLEILVLILLSVLLSIVNSMSMKLRDETQKIRNYMYEISNKNYEAVLHIKHFQEHLEISLLLKNIIKRLNNKDKKKK